MAAARDPWDPYLGYGEFGQPVDIAHILPRHVGSRILTSDRGETFWRPASDVFETDDELIIHCDVKIKNL